MYLQENKKYFRDEYFATETEISYILSDFYTLCTKETTKITRDVDVINIPSKAGIEMGEIPEGKNVIILLYCSEQNRYKVKYNDLIGWVPGSTLANPACKDEMDDNEKIKSNE